VVRVAQYSSGQHGSSECRKPVFVFVWTDSTVVRAAAYTDIDAGRAAAARLAEERG
jgi:hypothetical protein